MLITIGTKLNSLDEAENLIENSVEISDYELVSCIPIIENGYEQVINLKDIKKMHENTGKSFTECFDEICAANKVSNPVLSVNESDYIEDDSLKSLTEYFSNYSIKKIPISSSPIYICAKKAIDELAYNGNGSLLESFMEDDYVPFSYSIYNSIINEAGHKRGANVRKASKLINKATIGTAPNGSDGQQQEPSANPPQQNDQSGQQNDTNNNTKTNGNNNNQPQTQNTTQQQQQQKQPNTNSSQPTSNTNSNQSQPNSNGQPQQNDDRQDQQKEKQVESTINNIEKEAENKPAGFISSKIAALRKLYQNWLAKKNQEHDQGKIGFFSNILRVITNCIDRLLAKLQGAKNAENNATGNNAQAANNAASQAQPAQTQANNQTVQSK